MKKLSILSGLIFLLTMSGAAQASSLDSPAYHIKAAVNYLDQGRDKDALREYKAAIKRDAGSFESWLGSAHILIRLHDDQGATQALASLKDLAEKKPQKFEWLFADLQYNVVFKPKSWLSKAKDDYFKAKNINAKHAGLHLWVARAYRDGDKKRKARTHYIKVIELGGQEAALATSELNVMQRKVTAGGTGKGVAGELAGKTSVDRATLTAVLLDQVDVQKLFGKRVKTVVLPEDSKNSPYAAAIETILNSKMTSIELDAQGRFHPKQSVTRFEMARLIQEYFVAVTHDEGLNRAFVGTKSPFPDLSAHHYAFNAVFLAVTRGLMQPKDILTGKFEGEKQVSGVDLLLILRKLKLLTKEK